MSDSAIDPSVEPISSAPEAAQPEAVASTEMLDQAPDKASAAAHELAFPTGSAAQQVLDVFIDAESAEQSMNEIKAALPHIDPNTTESAVFRLHQRKRLLRTSPGRYKLAPATPPEPTKPAPLSEPVRNDGITDEAWLDAIERWLADASTWPTQLGLPPDQADNKIPQTVKTRINDRLRKQRERARQRAEAIARQEAADRQLRAQLLDASGGNYTPGPGIDDLAPIRLALTLVPIDIVLLALRRIDPRLCLPTPEPLRTWRDQALLQRIAQYYCRFVAVPSMVDAWSKATAKAPGKAAGAPAAAGTGRGGQGVK